MNAKPLLLLATLASTTWLAACAVGTGSTQRPASERPVVADSPPGGQCLSVSQARDFRFLDEQNLVVFSPGNQPWHVQLRGGCPELDGQVRIALRARSDQMCGYAGDEVIVRGAFSDRCPVANVTRLDSAALEVLTEAFTVRGRSAGEFEVEIPRRQQ